MVIIIINIIVILTMMIDNGGDDDDDDAYTLRREDPLSLPVEDQLLNAKYVISCARKGTDRVRDCLLWMMWMLLWVVLASSLWDGYYAV